MCLNWILLFFMLIGSITLCVEAIDSNDILKPKICSLFGLINRISNVTAKIVEKIDLVSFPENILLQQEYDFIIIGSGPSGCVLANRLSSGNHSVLLLEAGSAENPIITDIPMGAPNLQQSEYNWNYVTEVQDKACLSMIGQRCRWPHGRGLGGSTILNYLIYTRGNRRDFDRIAAAGNLGWDYESILPYYQKIEKSFIPPIDDSDSFGESGPLQIEEARFKTPIAKAFVESAERLNYTYLNYNGGNQIGVSYLQSSTQNGWRQTAAKAFLSPVKHRPNLDISLRSWATKLLLNKSGDQVKAVQFYRNKREHVIKVRKEVILAAGAFESPKLLMLSGIGPEKHLKEKNITVVKDLPVGENLAEHIAVFGPIFVADNLTDGLVNINDVIQLRHILEILEGKGPMSSTGIETLLYMKTNNSIDPDPEYPDIEILQAFATVAFDTSQVTRRGIGLAPEAYDAIFKPIENRRAFQLLPMLLHPRSKGFLKLKSRNPFHHPLFYPNFFADARDIDTLVESIRESIRIVEQPEFQSLGVKLYNASVPGCEHTKFNSDEYWRCYIQHLSATLHHQIGTCKMGPASDSTAVVDANGIVHGFSNLRVADISILPESPSGHTAAISFLIGEKLSNSIQNDWLPKESNIQKLVRVRKAIDWLYQDPEHVPKTRENATVSNISTFIAYPSVKLPQQTPSAEMIHVLHSLNMSALHEQSQQFKYSTIGDVGTILWGSLSNTKTIDFKSKLAENTNSTAINKTNLNELKPKIFKRIQKLNFAEPKTNITKQTQLAMDFKEEENNTPMIDIMKTTLPTTENSVDITETVHTEIMNATNTDNFEGIEKDDTLNDTQSLIPQSTDNPSDFIGISNSTAQSIRIAYDNSSAIESKSNGLKVNPLIT